MKSGSPGSTSPAATSTDATTGARGLRERRTRESQRAPRSAENARCAEAWVPTCRCGWAPSPRCTWTPALPLTPSYRAAMSAQRGQPNTGPRPLCPMGHTRSGPSAPSAPPLSAPPAGYGSSSRDPSTNRASGSYTNFIRVANVYE